jgi:hypothetical protein
MAQARSAEEQLQSVLTKMSAQSIAALKDPDHA